MDGIPAPTRLQKQLGGCPQCGSAWRIKRGLCVSCLLAQGLITEGSNGESLDDVLGEVDLRDNEWRVGDYQILQEIGSGGIGVVYRARHQRSRRVVALKQILPYHADSQRTVSRFWRETEAAATLDHPYILPIYDVGDSLDGLPFFTMKFAIGGSLQKKALSLRDDPRRVAAFMGKVAHAIQYAHDRRILHGDLKPSNILLDGQGEPMVSDFGLAKWLDSTSDRNPTLTVFGTAGYIAPEQARSARSGEANLTPAADIYSLGAILFDLFTGRPPFLGEHALAAIRQAGERPAPKLRSLAPSLDRDLETICAKCLERDPAARYQSAAELADDLQRWLEHRPIMARPLWPPARLLRWARRHPAASSVVAAAAVLLALAALGGKMMSDRNRSATPLSPGLAVLPLESSSSIPEDVLFADSVQDDVLTKLAKIRDLKVISRDSVMHYRPTNVKRNYRQIGGALGVSHVLEGSASKVGIHLYVTARLIDTRTGAQLWAEQYQRDVKDLFDVERDIAQKVAARLGARISTDEKRAIDQPPTADFVAFEFYNRARNLLPLRLSSAMKSNLLQAVDLLSEAVARDPSFFEAYCQLATAADRLYFEGYDHSPERLALAKSAVDTASRLRPDAGETHLARAYHLYQGHLDYDGALAELALAARSLPNHPQVFALMGYVQRRQGRWDESTRNLERASDLDPANVEILQQIALSYGMLRRYAEEKSILERALAIEPDDVDTKVALAAVQFHWKADTAPWRQTFDFVRGTKPRALLGVADDWLSWALAERDAAAAENILDIIGDIPLSDYKVHLTRHVMDGVVARMQHDETKARSAFSIARAEQERIVQADPTYGPAFCALGLIDAALGRKEEALHEARRAVELLPPQKDAVDGPVMIKYLALIAAWAGDKDLAFGQLAIAVRPPSAISYGQLKLLPFWDPLRSDPRFKEILASLAPEASLKR